MAIASLMVTAVLLLVAAALFLQAFVREDSMRGLVGFILALAATVPAFTYAVVTG